MSNDIVFKEIGIKNMVCQCCCKVIKQEFEKENIEVVDIRIGSAKIRFDSLVHSLNTISEILKRDHFSLIMEKEDQVIESVKIGVYDLVYRLNNVNSIIRKSEYIVEKVGMNYSQISKIFSKHEGVTLEKFIINHKINRVKDLIREGEFTLSEIAYMMDYSTVQHLSTQFKKITGVSVSEFKKTINP